MNYSETNVTLNKEKIGKFICQKRKEKNLTQQELADKLYVSDRAVSKWERGLSVPDIETLRKLSNIYNVSTDDILSAKEETIEKIEHRNNKTKPFILLTIALLCLYIIMYNISTILVNFNIEYTFIMFSIAFVTMIFYIKNNRNEVIKNRVIIFTTIVYSIAIVTYVFYTGVSFKVNNIKFESFEVNLIPFESIIKTITLVAKKIQPTSYIFNYLIVDLCMFMPYALFIPYLLKNNTKIKNYIIYLLIVIIKELLQLITGYGIFDINDIILNLLGISIMSTILKKGRII